MSARKSGIRITVVSVLVMLFCGCAVNSRFGKNRLLTQKQIVGKWIEESPVPITFEEAFKIRNDFEANYIILPKNSDVQIEKVIELFFNWCIPGGRTWLYTTPELDLDFYVLYYARVNSA